MKAVAHASVPILGDNNRSGVVIQFANKDAFFLSCDEAEELAFDMIRCSKLSQLLSVLTANMISRGHDEKQVRKALQEFVSLIKSPTRKK